MIASRLPLACLAATLALAGCGRADKDVEALDRELIGNAAGQSDPALTASLEDQIVVDPALARQSGGQAAAGARSARGEPSGAPARLSGPSAADCYADLAYGNGWARKLPAGVPLYPGAAIDEAAGNDRPGCATRVVSYASDAAAPALVAFYVAQAKRAGWAAEHVRRNGDEVVAGERAGAAFYVAITPGPRGAAVNIVTGGD